MKVHGEAREVLVIRPRRARYRLASPRWAALSLLVVAVSLLAAACGSSDTSDEPLVVGGLSETVVMEDTTFRPGNLQVPVGATVTFTNRDAAAHDAQAEDGSWETEQLGEDESDSVTFVQPGEWFYKCTIHPSMKARITVVEDGAAPATPTVVRE